MSLLKELKNLDIRENLENELKQQDLPLVMWGAGEVAQEVNYYLKKYDIYLSDVFVDDAYYSKGTLFDGKPVLSMSMLKKKYALVNVILGCSNYEKIKYLESLTLVNKVFYLFSSSYGISEKTALSEIEENIVEFEEVGNIFADDISYKNYLAFLKTRVSGNISFVLDLFNNEINYFNNDIFTIDDKEVFLDVGAYDGDTIRLFLQENNGRYQHIYAVEPDEVNKKMLENYVQESGLLNVTISGSAAWKEKGELRLVMNDNRQLLSFVFNEESITGGARSGIKAESLDEMFQYQENISLIKINYLEGAEETLQGARKILKIHKPKLAVLVGSGCKNIRSIPMLIKEINPDYKLYLRYNRGAIATLTCYGII